MLLNN